MTEQLPTEDRLVEIRKIAENDIRQECDSIIPANWLLALVECAEAAKALHDGCPDGTDQNDMWLALGLALAKIEDL